jgi:acyl carrier protein phosphodiesterase
MIEYNILFNYQFKEGIEKVLNGMNRRTKGKSQMNLAIEDLRNLENEFQEDFTLFFKDLQEHISLKLKELTTIY